MEHSDIVNKFIISYFYNLLESMGNRRRLITCVFIFHPHAGVHRFAAQC